MPSRARRAGAPWSSFPKAPSSRGTGRSTKRPSPEADARRVPAGEGRGQLRERASRFLAFVFPRAAAEDGSEPIAALAREHHDATHVAFAWTVGAGDSVRARSSDAGEPSGTAGKPIAAAIEASGLSDVLV